jgi:hypothetical protein
MEALLSFISWRFSHARRGFMLGNPEVRDFKAVA